MQQSFKDMFRPLTIARFVIYIDKRLHPGCMYQPADVIFGELQSFGHIFDSAARRHEPTKNHAGKENIQGIGACKFKTPLL